MRGDICDYPLTNGETCAAVGSERVKVVRMTIDGTMICLCKSKHASVFHQSCNGDAATFRRRFAKDGGTWPSASGDGRAQVQDSMRYSPGAAPTTSPSSHPPPPAAHGRALSVCVYLGVVRNTGSRRAVCVAFCVGRRCGMQVTTTSRR